MPGRLLNSFRSGNIAEHLGLLLLKGIAAVAEVARPEDIGIDAIATLLRKDEDGNSYGEDTFFVQLKSASYSKLEYKDHELEWLVSQQLPMFIGLVSLEKSQISLYPTIFVNQAVLSLHAQKVTIRFGKSDIDPFLAGQKWTAWKSEPDNAATVWLGEPLLQWAITDLVDVEWAKQAYEILKKFITVAQIELELVSLGQYSIVDWKTNDASSITSKSGVIKGHPDDLESIVERVSPHLQSIMTHAFVRNDDLGNKLAISLLAFANSLREVGIEIDSENLFGKLFSALLNRQDNGTK